MKAVMLQVPEALLEERRRRGADRWDEMWEGVLHMVPPPSERHQNLGSELLEVLRPIARHRGLKLNYEVGFYASDSNYRVPDLSAYQPEQASTRGIESKAELVVEIRSPGDETDEKIPWYAAHGVREILSIDRDTLEIELFIAEGESLIAVRPAHSHVLGCTFETIDGPVLHVTHEGGSVDIVL